MSAATATHNGDSKLDGATYGGGTSQTWRTVPGLSNGYNESIETVVLVVSLLLVSVVDVRDWTLRGSVVKFASDCAARDVWPWRARTRTARLASPNKLRHRAHSTGAGNLCSVHACARALNALVARY